MKVERGTHKKEQSSSNPSPVLPGWVDGSSTKDGRAERERRTGAMEDERVIRCVPHVAEDGAKRGPARVENLGIQLHECLVREDQQVEDKTEKKKNLDGGPHLRLSACIELKASTRDDTSHSTA